MLKQKQKLEATTDEKWVEMTVKDLHKWRLESMAGVAPAFRGY